MPKSNQFSFNYAKYTCKPLSWNVKLADITSPREVPKLLDDSGKWIGSDSLDEVSESNDQKLSNVKLIGREKAFARHAV